LQTVFYAVAPSGIKSCPFKVITKKE